MQGLCNAFKIIYYTTHFYFESFEIQTVFGTSCMLKTDKTMLCDFP